MNSRPDGEVLPNRERPQVFEITNPQFPFPSPSGLIRVGDREWFGGLIITVRLRK